MVFGKYCYVESQFKDFPTLKVCKEYHVFDEESGSEKKIDVSERSCKKILNGKFVEKCLGKQWGCKRSFKFKEQIFEQTNWYPFLTEGSVKQVCKDFKLEFVSAN